MKIGLTFDEILKATGGSVIKKGLSRQWENFCRDSRQIQGGDFYIPLVGKKFDGHNFIEEVIKKGASGSLWGRDELPSATIPEAFTLIRVGDTLKALGSMGKYIRRKWKGIVIGVTGSAGKTTTKELIWAGLNGYAPTFKTPGNFNNLVGVPISLLSLAEEQHFGVIEMGMNTPGEISKLSDIARPDWAIITSVGPAHIGAFKDLDGIIREKGMIIEYAREGAVFPAGFTYFRESAVRNGLKFITIGPMGEVELVKWENNLVIRWEENKIEFPFTFETLMEAEDFTIAIAFAIIAGFDPEKFGRFIKENYKPPEGRGRIYRGKFTLIDDTYNANPISFRKAIDYLKKINGERYIVVMGDMMELGEKEEELHREVGRYIAEQGIDIFIVIGRRAFWAGEEAEKMGINVFFVENMMEMEQLLQIILKEGDVLLVKASRAMRLERVVNFIKKFEGEGNAL